MKKIILTLVFLLSLCKISFGAISVNSFLSADDVTIGHLEEFRTTVVNAINSADGGLIQAGTIPSSKLDANANPENRWDEAFNDFVYTGLLPATDSSLTSAISAGTAYIKGIRVIKDAVNHTYTANKNTYVDLSKTGVFTYSEITQGESVPGIAANSIRLAMVSSDTTSITHVINCKQSSPAPYNNQLEVSDSNYNVESIALVLSHRTGSSGIAPANNIGAGLMFRNDRNFTDIQYSSAKIVGSLANISSALGQLAFYAINGGNFNTYFTLEYDGSLLPSAAGTAGSLGSASLYWNDISYKTLTDRGCLGWFDEGVEMPDGSKVSDVQAISLIKKHPTKKTVYGAPMLDYKSFPKVAYKKADKKIYNSETKENEYILLPRDENDNPIGGSDGIEMTSMFSIMLGAIKELGNRVEVLEAKNANLEARITALETP